jgi:hypothetical protein
MVLGKCKYADSNDSAYGVPIRTWLKTKKYQTIISTHNENPEQWTPPHNVKWTACMDHANKGRVLSAIHRFLEIAKSLTHHTDARTVKQFTHCTIRENGNRPFSLWRQMRINSFGFSRKRDVTRIIFLKTIWNANHYRTNQISCKIICIANCR